MVDSKIIWQFVCLHFNLHLNETFKIDSMKHSLRYRITQNGLEVYDELEERWKEACSTTEEGLLEGKIKVIKLKWKPKRGEKYYTLYKPFNKPSCVTKVTWNDCSADYNRMIIGSIFKTEDEAQSAIFDFERKLIEAKEKYME